MNGHVVIRIYHSMTHRLWPGASMMIVVNVSGIPIWTLEYAKL